MAAVRELPARKRQVVRKPPVVLHLLLRVEPPRVAPLVLVAPPPPLAELPGLAELRRQSVVLPQLAAQRPQRVAGLQLVARRLPWPVQLPSAVRRVLPATLALPTTTRAPPGPQARHRSDQTSRSVRSGGARLQQGTTRTPLATWRIRRPHRTRTLPPTCSTGIQVTSGLVAKFSPSTPPVLPPVIPRLRWPAWNSPLRN